MKRIFVTIILLAFATSSYCQITKETPFSVDFKFATTDKTSSLVNIVFSYYPSEKAFLIDSDKAETISRNQVLHVKDTKEELKIFTELGYYVFIKGKGGFVKCEYVNSSLNMKIVYTDFRIKDL